MNTHEQLALVDLPGGPRRPGDEETLSYQRNLTQRQLTALRFGYHPLGLPPRSVLRLHADAPPADDRAAAGPRCGTCVFRAPMAGEHAVTAPKCWHGQRPGHTPPRAAFSAATDCRAWWPACVNYQPRPDEADPAEET
jgi:hypothetical protein